MASRGKPPKSPSSSFDARFDEFLKASMDSNSDVSLSKVLKLPPKRDKQWWQASNDSSDDSYSSDAALIGTGKSFLKSKSAVVPPIVKEKPNEELQMVNPSAKPTFPVSENVQSSQAAPFSAKDPFYKAPTELKMTEEFRESQLSYDQSTETGAETLEEAAEKSQFFKELQAEAEHTLDFSKLNKQLGDTDASVHHTGHLLSAFNNETLRSSAEESSEVRIHDSEITDLDTDSPKRLNLLAKVSLSDTLDTSGMLATSAPTAEFSGAMGNTSQMDMDDVRKAYKEIHDEEGDVQTQPFSQIAESTEVYEDNRDEESDIEHEEDVSDTQSAKDSNVVPEATNSQTSHHFEIDASTENPPAQSIFDLEAVADVELPELQPIKPTKTKKPDSLSLPTERKSGLNTPPTVLEYQTIDQLSPILNEQAFPYPSNGWQTIKTSLAKTPKANPLRKTRTLDRPSSASKAKTSTDKYSHVKSSGYGLSDKSMRGQPSTPDNKPSNKASAKKSLKRRKSPKKRPVDETTLQPPLESSPVKLIQSVESFAHYLKEQFKSSTPANKLSVVPYGEQVESAVKDREGLLLEEVKEWQQKWRDECRIREKITNDFIAAQKQWEVYSEETRLRYEEQISNCRQQIYVLEAKLSVKAPDKDPKILDSSNDFMLKKLEVEIKSQEKLIAGYQQENERLYKEIKQADSLHKQTYDKLYQDNIKTASENALLREKLSIAVAGQKDRALSVVDQTVSSKAPIVISSPTHELASLGIIEPETAALGAGRIAELKSQLLKSKTEVGELAARVSRLMQEKTELCNKLEFTIKDRDNLKELLLVSKQPAEFKVIQERYQQEITVLEKKIKWYIENQRLLDSDVEKLNLKDLQINELQSKLKQFEHLRTQASNIKTGESKRIKDLERQVRELEQIIRKRNPNSIPSLIWAASMMPDQPADKPPTIKFLEDQVDKLEKRLAEKDGEASRLLRAMEQQCNQSKTVYEDRIAELQSELSKAVNGMQVTSRHSTVAALEKELDAVKEQQRRKQSEQQRVIEELKDEIERLKNKEYAQDKRENKVLRQSKEAGELKITELQSQLDNKFSEVKSLHEMIERLQKEKRQLLVELNHIQSIKSDSYDIQQKMDNRTKVLSKFSPEKRKDYIADNFSAEHITDVLTKNKELIAKNEKLQLELSQLKVDRQRELANIELQVRQETDALMQQMEDLKQQTQKDKDKTKAEYALKQSNSELVKYKNQVAALETVVKHFKEDRKQQQVDAEELSSLRIKNVTLEHRIKSLEEKLEEAKENYSPEMRDFERMQNKISAIEERFTSREEELRRIISQNQKTYQQDLSSEVLKWKKVVELKNKDIEKFRRELDLILNVLKELQKQGIKVPSVS